MCSPEVTVRVEPVWLIGLPPASWIWTVIVPEDDG